MNPAIAGDLQDMGPRGQGAWNSMAPAMTNLQFHMWIKTGDLIHLTPADCFYFCDESMWSLNDGYIEGKMDSPGYPDCPANYDCDGNCFSFVDAHVEFHHWIARTGGSTPGGIPLCPYAKGVRTPGSPTFWPGAPGNKGDPDWLWLRSHTSAQY
jgi:hypothetical protein